MDKLEKYWLTGTDEIEITREDGDVLISARDPECPNNSLEVLISSALFGKLRAALEAAEGYGAGGAFVTRDSEI